MDEGKVADLTTSVLIDIREEIRGLRGDVGRVEGRMGGLEAEMGGLKTEMVGLKTEMGGLKTEMKGIRAELHEHGVVIGELVQVVSHQGVTLKQILRAVEHGNERRDDRVEVLEQRVERLEQHVGLPRR